ncbi:MAG: 4-alpha-glucanotransferase [Candidatus Kerfeldbacteria bacterium]|nr:4-alpha-glucanotransferase [Candidatus Kerfeldbacteria bacterium]
MHRRAGILLHPTSLANHYPIGDVGPAARQFVDFLAAAGQTLWQVLPLNPPDFLGSPYASKSAFAISTLLISPEDLVEEGFLGPAELPHPVASQQHVTDHVAADLLKHQLRDIAFERFTGRTGHALREEFAAFRDDERAWLDPYVLFQAIRGAHDRTPWWTWPAAFRRRDPSALADFAASHADRLQYIAFGQWLAQRQWLRLKQYANAHGIQIIGDLPLFVTHDSVDVWLHPEQYLLDAQHQPTVVAGAPPDSFTDRGQRWGNPLYRWSAQQEHNFAWWVARIHRVARLFDVIRLDHFRGYDSLWHIPAAEDDPRNGQWTPTPGRELLTLFRQTTDAPLIAEDLGSMQQSVEALRDAFDLPGMRVTVFGLGREPSDPSLPQNAPEHSAVYTGTHDTDTLQGWLGSAGAEPRRRALVLARCAPEDFSWAMIGQGMASRAETFIAPLQDVLGLQSGARMNTPGTKVNNWIWRVAGGAFTPALAARLRHLTVGHGRRV